MENTYKFDRKTVLITGATGNIGSTLARKIAGMGATVIAIDQDEGKLINLARHHPDLIQPLCWTVNSPNNCRLFGDIWQKEPIHCLYHLRLCSDLGGGDLNEVEGMSALNRAILPALTHAKGAIVTLCPKGKGIESETLVGAISNMAKESARLFMPLNVRVNTLLLAGDVDVVSPEIIDALMFFGHSRAITGAVVDVGVKNAKNRGQSHRGDVDDIDTHATPRQA